MGLPGSSDDALDVPSEGGLAAQATPESAIGGGADEGSRFNGSGFGFFPSAMKLPMTT